MNAQEIFDKALSGVIAQGNLSVKENGSCKYRMKDGRACGVGQLIDDETAHHWDGYGDTSVEALNSNNLLPEPLSANVDLLADIQAAHDAAANDHDDPAPRLLEFLHKMQTVAYKHYLQVNSTEDDIKKVLK